jgi:hypothetical protein
MGRLSGNRRHGGGAVALVEHCIAALGTQRYLDGIRQNIHTPEHALPRVVAKAYVFCRHVLIPLVEFDNDTDAMDTARRSSIADKSPSAQRRLKYSFQTLVSGPVGMHHSPLPPSRRKATSHRNVSASHSRPRTSRLCVVSAGPFASRPSLGAWVPKPITVNHRGRQFFAQACNRDGVINPASVAFTGRKMGRCLAVS